MARDNGPPDTRDDISRPSVAAIYIPLPPAEFQHDCLIASELIYSNFF